MSNEAAGSEIDKDLTERRLRKIENAISSLGDFVEKKVLVASAVSLSTGVAGNVASILLGPGFWHVSGVVSYHNDPTTVMADVTQSISVTSATVGDAGSFTADLVGLASGIDCAYNTPLVSINLTVPTTVYLVAKSNFATSTASVYGYIHAHRAVPLSAI